MHRSHTHPILTILTLAALVFAATPPVRAADDAGAPGGFLRYGSSARALGLGNAVTALADDAASSYWNPAGYASLRTMEFTAMGATLFEDTQYSFLTLGLPTEGYGSFALTGAFLRSGGFERSTLYEDLGETFDETAGAFGLSYARGSGRLSYGVHLKSVTHSLAGASGGGFGADVGVYLRPHRTISLGFAVQNAVRPEVTLDEQPESWARTFRAGTALHLLRNRFVVSTEVVKTDDMEADLKAGIEAWAVRNFALRGGFDAAREQGSFGAAFRWQSWQFDYGYLTHDLGATHVLSATFRFGVPYGVKMKRDRARFSPSGDKRDVTFDIDTAVRGEVEAWTLEIRNERDEVVRRLRGNGSPPEGITWEGADEDGRLVPDGRYTARITVLDDMTQEWDFDVGVDVLGFRDRTRSPIRVEISGSEAAERSPQRRKEDR
ncbi:MAG TPA: PorV/PorQ family protein [Candidatus Krumholzibacteria bacterium]|nr:PorV/PorQ family protein [Candidatus Krumholzibacteria bacterium]